MALGIAVASTKRIERIVFAAAMAVFAAARIDSRTGGEVEALTAMGALPDPPGVTVTTSAAIRATASAPVAKATSLWPNPRSTSTVVGPTSDGCLHVLSCGGRGARSTNEKL